MKREKVKKPVDQTGYLETCRENKLRNLLKKNGLLRNLYRVSLKNLVGKGVISKPEKRKKG